MDSRSCLEEQGPEPENAQLPLGHAVATGRRDARIGRDMGSGTWGLVRRRGVGTGQMFAWRF
jgi:hypothetical protein